MFAYDLYHNKERSENYDDDSTSDDDGFKLEESDCDEQPLPKKAPKKITKQLHNLTDVKCNCVVGRKLSTMSDKSIEIVDVVLDKRLKKVKNKEVKSCVLQKKHQALV